MAQYIRNANIFGRVGTGIGQGLAESLPKEIERGRLQAGLENLANQKGLTNFQQFAKLASISGVTPQMIQSGSELLRQEGVREGLKNVNASPQQVQQSPLQQYIVNQPQNAPNQTRDVATTNPTQAALNPYIPRTYQQNLARAAQLQQENPKLYPNPEQAIQAAQAEDTQNQAINSALQGQRQSQIGVQKKIRDDLDDLRNKSNVKIPENVFQEVENKALYDVKTDKKTELEAAKDALKEADKISREYNALDRIGNWDFIFQSPREAARGIESLRQDFKKRDDLENFADSLVGVNGLSYLKAYHKAFPVQEYPTLDKEIKSLKPLGSLSFKDPATETLKISEKIAKSMGKDASPLSIAQELMNKNYDPHTWMEYLVRNKNKLNLSERQVRELEKPVNVIPSLNDVWFFLGNPNYQE